MKRATVWACASALVLASAGAALAEKPFEGVELKMLGIGDTSVTRLAPIVGELWQVVQPGGKLLYATCSVFPAENGQQIERFLARRPQAGRCHEEQLLPTAEHDGFYYCLLEKRA